ncbi:IS66 family transposase [Advenella incenata]|uniref:IS66 family transposase n=1 Tax=Advenella incenata TaxID=267800 RepID=UPI002683D263
MAKASQQVILTQPMMHVDETPVKVLQPRSKRTHRAYLWAYAPGAFQNLKAVVYYFTEGRAGTHARTFLGGWRGQLVYVMITVVIKLASS